MTQKLTCAVATVGRSDFSILKPLIAALDAAEDFEVGLWVGGAHFDKDAGRTAGAVEATGWPIWGTIEAPEFGKSETSTTAIMGQHVTEVSRLISDGPRPDFVVILGDRYEAVSVALGLVPHNIPVAHISGGSVTEGAIDDVFRHCISKTAAWHFCEIPEFADRIHRMGEPIEAIYVVGALGLDGIKAQASQPFEALATEFHLSSEFKPGYALATYHPETRTLQETADGIDALLLSLRTDGRPVIFTYPNADPGADIIIDRIEAEAQARTDFAIVKNFGATWFYAAMTHAGCVIGNSSSGIIEAASFGLPVIDIGDRQKGRYHGVNVHHCRPTAAAISEALKHVSTAEIQEQCRTMVNPYGDGQATSRILTAMRKVDWTQDHSRKPFADYHRNHPWKMAEIA